MCVSALKLSVRGWLIQYCVSEWLQQLFWIIRQTWVNRERAHEMFLPTLGINIYTFGTNMNLYGTNMLSLGTKVPFEMPQWQLMYLFSESVADLKQHDAVWINFAGCLIVFISEHSSSVFHCLLRDKYDTWLYLCLTVIYI